MLELRKIADDDDATAPAMLLPFGEPVSIPKYTLVCAPRLIPVHVTVAPVPAEVMPPIEQLPPPGSPVPDPVMTNAEALVAIPSTESIVIRAMRFITVPLRAAADCPISARVLVMTASPWP